VRGAVSLVDSLLLLRHHESLFTCYNNDCYFRSNWSDIKGWKHFEEVRIGSKQQKPQHLQQQYSTTILTIAPATIIHFVNTALSSRQLDSTTIDVTGYSAAAVDASTTWCCWLAIAAACSIMNKVDRAHPVNYY
jgi:hypothetical protein